MMIKLRISLFFILNITLLYLPYEACAQQAPKAYRYFWHPTLRGERLAYCTFKPHGCGKAVADLYCQTLGYDASSQNVKAFNLGLTHFIDARVRCTGWLCSGFSTITCVKKITHKLPEPYYYRKKSFALPRYNDYRLDWCYRGQSGCGARAAHSFCKRMGFMRAASFAGEDQVGATKKIGSEQLCFNQHCQAFKKIVCYR